MKKAFTLIELLVCICMVGILAGLFLPVIAKYKYKSIKISIGDLWVFEDPDPWARRVTNEVVDIRDNWVLYREVETQVLRSESSIDFLANRHKVGVVLEAPK